MKKLLLLIFLFAGFGLSAMAQLFIFGAQCGSNYSRYILSEDNSAITALNGSLGFHSGFFCRYDFESFYLGSDLNYSSTLGGTIDDTNSSFKVRSGSVNLPAMIGKKFYPGIRLYVGGMPAIYIKTNENELLSYLETSPFMGSDINAIHSRNDFIFFMIGGFELEVSKFNFGMRYEHPLDYFIQENFSTGGDISSKDNYHYLAQITFTIGYRFN